MQCKVNEDCIGCGFCVAVCPQVFRMTADGVSEAIEGEIAPEWTDSAKEAADGCPVQAIEEE